MLVCVVSQVLSRFIDSVYSNEGDKVSYLLKIILKPTWLILKSYRYRMHMYMEIQ